MRSTHSRCLVVGVVSAVFTALPVSATAQAPTPPCTLLTRGQVASAVGSKVGAGQAIAADGCSWMTPGGVQPFVTVTLAFVDANTWDAMKTPLPNIPKTSAAGIGDEAFFATVGNLVTLSVKGKSSVFVVRLYGIHDLAKEKSIERALALDVLGKL